RTRLVDERGQSHLGEHVEVVVASGTVRAEAHVHTSVNKLRDGGNPGGQLEVGAGTVTNVSARLAQDSLLLMPEPNAMRQADGRTGEPQGMEVLDVVFARALANCRALCRTLAGMGVNAPRVLASLFRHAAKQLLAAREHEARR